MNNLVCITGGKSSAPFIQAAINKKLNIILFDLDLQAFCRKYSNDFFEISCHDKFRIYSIVKKLNKKCNIKGVLCYSSSPEALITASYISNKLNLPTFSKKSVEICYDKNLFYKALSSVINLPKRIKPSEKSIKFPCIIKKKDGIGSKGTRKIDTKSFFDLELKKIQSKINKKDFFVEEFIEGNLFHIDGIVQDNNIEIINAVKKNVTYINQIPLTSGYESYFDLFKSKIFSDISKQINNGVKVININNHFFGVDLIISPDFNTFKILEIGYLLDAKMDRFLFHSGIKIYDIFIDLVCGNKIKMDKIKKIKRNKYLNFFYSNKTGKLKQKNNSEHLVEWERLEDETVYLPKSIADTIGWHIYDSSIQKKEVNSKFYKVI
jgi:biotin carboxylase